MITIIHGDDITSSRNFLLEQKQKDKNLVSLAPGFTVSDLAQNLEGSSLFFETKTIVIEDFFARAKKKSKDTKEITDFINKHDKKVNLILWEGKELGKRDIGLFPSAIIKQFKLPKALFVFLDNLLPGNGINSVLSFHLALETSALELIFFMMQRQFRLLLALRHPEHNEGSLDSSASPQNDNAQIDEAVRLAPWQRQRLERQSSSFSAEKLREIYKKLFDIEVKQRTGNLPLSLVQTIDFFLLEI